MKYKAIYFILENRAGKFSASVYPLYLTQGSGREIKEALFRTGHI